MPGPGHPGERGRRGVGGPHRQQERHEGLRLPGGHPGGRGDLVQRVSEHVLAHLDRPFHIAQLADAVPKSPRHLDRVFRRWVGQSPKQYVLRLKLAEAQRLLLTTDLRGWPAFGAG